MPFVSVTTPAVGAPTARDLISTMIDNESFLNSQLASLTGGSVILNGSFENDTDSDGTPDEWTKTLYTGGTGAIDTTTQNYGAKSFKFVSPGGASNGGGYLTSSNYFEVSPARSLTIGFQMKSSVADVRNVVELLWFKADYTASATTSTTLLDDSATNPTSWTAFLVGAAPPSDARFAKLRLTGAHSSDATAGSVWFDDVFVSPLQFTRRVEFNLAGTQSWLCPTGVTSVRVTCIGGGGGGAYGPPGPGGGAGGGGGAAFSFATVTPATAYAVVVGAAGTGGVGGNGTAGGNSTFNTTTVIGNGGAAASGTSGGAGGSGTGTTVVSGQSGSGGSGGSGGAGGSCYMGGGGGGGGVVSLVGNVGSSPGGGGGGGANSQNGGAGGAGRVIIEW